jgi:Cu/Ag efflux protein CusF
LKLAFIAATIFAVSVLCPAASKAQTAPSESATATATVTAKIVAIDSTSRIVTLQDAKGNLQSIQAGPEMTRFSALKVGDTVTFVYQESVALSIAKAGTAPAPSSTPTLTRMAGDKPGGVISQTQTAAVTIAAIDLTTPSITVKTQDGKVITMLVRDKANLAGLNVGDVVLITYSQALAITVK